MREGTCNNNANRCSHNPASSQLATSHAVKHAQWKVGVAGWGRSEKEGLN
ncbi:hypothetical protein ZHAS_00013255 [Anopheles sinensis]|uniref:Uncharacterized protein n=1 Tax=Anopheles sinensis TaxID=74873 RepID=A0A084W515_ANOSI|nr:hypothetical protein ZHAS_00013255 [Anopheles sinensis]